MGYVQGVGVDQANIDAGADYLDTWNWLFFKYEPDYFTAEIRLGYEATTNREVVFIKPSFYLFPLAFFAFENSHLVKAGASFEWRKDFGDLNEMDHPDAAYRFIEIKPLLQINLSPNAYAAFEYSFKRQWVQWSETYKRADKLPLIQEQWINIRFGLFY
jgi:hypothetical protein